MSVVIYNVLVTTARSTPDSNAQSQPPTPYLVGLPGHMEKITDWTQLPPGIVYSKYKLLVDDHTDIQDGDQILAITELLSGLPWPGDYPGPQSGLPGASNTTWWVESAAEGAPGFLATREVYVYENIGGGPRAAQIAQ